MQEKMGQKQPGPLVFLVLEKAQQAAWTHHYSLCVSASGYTHISASVLPAHTHPSLTILIYSCIRGTYDPQQMGLLLPTSHRESVSCPAARGMQGEESCFTPGGGLWSLPAALLCQAGSVSTTQESQPMAQSSVRPLELVPVTRRLEAWFPTDPHIVCDRQTLVAMNERCSMPDLL